MPLPSLSIHGAIRCRARSKRSGIQCQNPAAYGMPTCRMHGARPSHTVVAGYAHPSFKHGLETLRAKAHRSEKLAELRELESIMQALEMIGNT